MPKFDLKSNQYVAPRLSLSVHQRTATGRRVDHDITRVRLPFRYK